MSLERRKATSPIVEIQNVLTFASGRNESSINQMLFGTRQNLVMFLNSLLLKTGSIDRDRSFSVLFCVVYADGVAFEVDVCPFEG